MLFSTSAPGESSRPERRSLIEGTTYHVGSFLRQPKRQLRLRSLEIVELFAITPLAEKQNSIPQSFNPGCSLDGFDSSPMRVVLGSPFCVDGCKGPIGRGV
jgi:hypothetical protein